MTFRHTARSDLPPSSRAGGRIGRPRGFGSRERACGLSCTRARRAFSAYGGFIRARSQHEQPVWVTASDREILPLLTTAFCSKL